MEIQYQWREPLNGYKCQLLHFLACGKYSNKVLSNISEKRSLQKVVVNCFAQIHFFLRLCYQKYSQKYSLDIYVSNSFCIETEMYSVKYFGLASCLFHDIFSLNSLTGRGNCAINVRNHIVHLNTNLRIPKRMACLPYFTKKGCIKYCQILKK